MSAIPRHRKQIARHVSRAFGAEGSIARHAATDSAHHVDVLSCSDVPTPGVTSTATIGLSEATLSAGQKTLSFGAEIVSACRTDVFDYPSLVSTAALHVLQDGWVCAPGAIFRDVVGMYDVSRTLRDVFFVSPFSWGTDLRFAEFTREESDEAPRKVAFVQMIPIAASETAYCEQAGAAALERLFENRQINVYDIHRDPVI